MERLVEEAPSIVDYYIDSMIGGGTSFQEKGEAAVRAATFITGIEDVIDRNLFIKRVSEKLGIDQDILKKEVHSRLYPKMRKEAQLSRLPKKETVGLEFNLIHLMMEYPAVVPAIIEARAMEYFLDRELKSIGQSWVDHVSAAEASLNPGESFSFLQGLDSSDPVETLMKLLFQESPFSQETLSPLSADMIRQVKRRWYKEQKKTITERLLNAQTSGNQSMVSELAKEKERLLREEKEL
ncbi:MAG: DNA primase [Syntrophus sp. PtaU1.Bin208]|nr:MAG: DNA primase [Syntrophus sp. PtaU1.Bin208]